MPGLSSISAFDLDKTLLNVNSSYAFGEFLFSQGQLSLPKTAYLVSCYAAHTAGFLGLESLHRLNFQALFKSKSKRSYEALVHQFLDIYLKQLICPLAFQACQQAKNDGHHLFILSSSPNFLVDAIGQRLSIDRCYSTSYGVDADGCFNALGTVMHGKEKARVLEGVARQWNVPKERIYAYSDSHLDLPFLEAAGNPIVVNPNSQLLKISTTRKWKILS